MTKFLASCLFVLVFSIIFGSSGLAQDAPETLVVTPTNPRGWSEADTRPGGDVNFIIDVTSPAPNGALQLTTDATTAAKAQYMHSTETPIADIVDLSYYTKQVSGPIHADPSYQLVLCLGGLTSPVTAANPLGCTGFTTMVFEPYQMNGLNPPTQLIVPGAWQQWDVDAGMYWSSRTYSSGSCIVTQGSGGPPFYSLSQLQSMCPAAVAVGFGVNIGTFNPSYNVYTDLVKFNSTTYDFEVYSTPSNMEDCKKGGWSTFNPPTGPYKNQGQCVSSTVPQ